jgi:hypothetical protein
MARCAAAKLLPFAAPLLSAGDETSGDDEATDKRDKSRAQPTPPLAPRGQDLDQVRWMKICVTPDGKKRMRGAP